MTGAVRAALPAAMLVLIAACGQKGPLYLPDEGGEIVTRPAPQSQRPESTAPQPSTSPTDSETRKPDSGKPESDRKGATPP